ncbi:MAG: DUF192 domain-containing protein [Coriobacteriales bacterium]|jgi:uncharacterized membrane protein (UPF0127 family)|nr:DUF192 domain-containing protein [Coriobacteriales bacterium]
MKLIFATSLWARLTGLLIRSRCANGEVLLLAPCKSIHSFGMQSPLDVAFLDAEARVLLSMRNLPPARTCSHPSAVAVMERRSNPQRSWPAAGETLHIQTSTIRSEEEGAI